MPHVSDRTLASLLLDIQSAKISLDKAEKELSSLAGTTKGPDVAAPKLCGTCIHFSAAQSCTRYPPVLIGWQRDEPTGDAIGEFGWPIVGDDDTCGEWSD